MINIVIPLLSTPVADDLDTANFAVRARANFLEVNPILSAINVMIGQLNVETASINSQAAGATTARTAAETAAAAAAVSAAAAAATSTAANWVSGTTYAAGNVRRSLIDGLPYRRLTAGAGTIDPRDDATNWALDFLQYDTGLPSIRPSLLLDFANGGAVDPRFTVTRASVASYYDAKGVLRWAPANTLRITHDPVTGERLGALLEVAATNMATWSEDLANVAWAKVRIGVTAGAGVAPDGSMSMCRLIPSAVSGNHYVAVIAAGVGVGTKVVVSAFARKAGKNRFKHLIQTGSNWPEAIFDLNSGAAVYASGATSGIEYVGNGVYRCWAAIVSTDVNLTLHVMPVEDDNSQDFVGDGVSGVDVWGVQIETGVVQPTSYIKTTAAAAARTVDILELTGAAVPALYNRTAGTMVFDLDSYTTDLGGYAGSIATYDTAGTNNRVTPYINDGRVGLYIGEGVGTQLANFGPATPVLAIGKNRVAISFKDGYAAIANNGKLVASLAGSFVLPPIDRVRFLPDPNRPVARHAYYPRAVSNSELMALSRI